MPPKISVVLPIYNAEPYLPACLDAILSQPIKELEILAVNNGCTDGCAKILAEYASRDSRIKIIEREHGEVSDARNSALDIASGEYLAFCDSDDTLPQDAYRVPLQYAERKNCDVVVSGHNNVWDNGEHVSMPLSRHERQSDFKLFFVTPCVWNKLIRRAFIEEHKIRFPNLIMGEDVLFLAQLLNCKPRIVHTSQLVYNYWYHTKAEVPSMTHRYTLDFFQLHLLCRERLLEEMKNTIYQQECEEYVFWGMIDFLLAFLFKIWDGDEREVAFELLRQHVLLFDLCNCEARFEAKFGVKLAAFKTISCEEYMVSSIRLDHKEMVLREYRAGMIGFRYIFKYISAWLEFKLGQGRQKG